MDLVFLSRLQFALNITFHYLFPPMTIGLSWMLIVIEGFYMKTGDKKYRRMAEFWTKIFALFFVMGVSTGFVQAFAFGNNWSTFSKFVGNVFGSILAAEGIFAFFLESGFLGIMLFGWDRVKPWLHYLSTILVSLGATFSATWIIIANSWMQTPAGHKIIGTGAGARAVVTDIWAVYFNPSFLDRLVHVLLGCWILGIFFMLSVSAYYLLRKRHLEFARFTMKLALIASIIALSLQLVSADSTAKGVAKNQPAKLAAMEGIYKTESASPMTLIGWVDEKEEKVHGLKMPGLLSFMIYYNFNRPVPGLDQIPRDEWPPVAGVFYSYHLMIYAWVEMMFCSIVGLILLKRGTLEKHRWFLWILVYSLIAPYLANTCGWFTAEIGRQPWLVQGILKTGQGVSKVLRADQVVKSLIMFTCMYALMGSLFVFLLHRKIQHGLGDVQMDADDMHYRNPYTTKS